MAVVSWHAGMIVPGHLIGTLKYLHCLTVTAISSCDQQAFISGLLAFSTKRNDGEEAVVSMHVIGF